GPTTPTVAYGIGEKIDDPVTMYTSDILTIPVNLAGLPGMSIPCGFSNDLPVGLQLIGNHFAEDTMYKAAYSFEQATDFHAKKPEILKGANK
ncbi:MAG: amidase family protein, partial [Tetragenococcus koreensis]